MVWLFPSDVDEKYREYSVSIDDGINILKSYSLKDKLSSFLSQEKQF
ncbi:MAG TPA: hypothetical protein VIY08_06860 [Candidatus Nitrosocosmicus sp.]